MDNEIIELHPPLVTFGSIDYDGDPQPANNANNNPPPPAPYDHKNLVVVNRNDLESILVKGAAVGTAPGAYTGTAGTAAGHYATAATAGGHYATADRAVAERSNYSAQNLMKQAPSNGYGHLRVSKKSNKE